MTAQSICRENFRRALQAESLNTSSFFGIVFQIGWQDDFPFPKVGFMLVSWSVGDGNERWTIYLKDLFHEIHLVPIYRR